MRLKEIHPLIHGLVRVLPSPGTPMAGDQHQDWLDCAASILALLYPEPTESTADRKDDRTHGALEAASPRPGEAPDQGQPGEGGDTPAGLVTGNQQAGTQVPSVDTNSPEVADEPGDGSQPSPSVGSSDRANVSTGVTGGERAAQNPVANPAVEAVDGSAMSEGAAVAVSPETAEAGSRLDAGRTASATSERMDATAGETAPDSPEEAPEVVADRARKPSQEQSEAEPVRQVGDDANPPDKSASSKGPAAPTLADKLRALNAAHPEFTLQQVAAELGETFERVRNNSNAHKIKWNNESVRSVGLQDRVSELHTQHPDWSDEEIAAAIGKSNGYVRATAQRLGLILPSRKPAGARSPAPAPEPAPRPERPPAPARAPVAARPSGSGSAVVTKPMARAPRGTRFNLRNDAGLYLHNSCETMTDNRKWAWEGSADQLLACRKRFPLATDLREQVVEKEAARQVA